MLRLRLAGYQHYVLLAVLCGFVLAVHERPESVFGRLLWLIDVGLFLLWQPVVSADRQLTRVQAVVVLAVVFGMAFQLNWGWLAAWGIFVASLIGGKVIVARSRRLGWFYLIGFGCMAVVLFTWISPQLFDEGARGGVANPQAWVVWAGFASLALAAVALPWGAVREEAAVYDFLVSLLILLLLAFILMLTNGLMVVRRVAHLEALVGALLSLGFLILFLSWAWNPRLGFSGMGSLASRYLLRLGFPFEDWLHRVSEAFDRHEVPDEFLREAIASFSDLPWVVGGVAEIGSSTILRFGEPDRDSVRLEYAGVTVTLYTTYRWTAALIWQANLLHKLVVDFYHAKQRDRQLRQMRYLQAVHETGSRVTHDVKNLLQSLDALCHAASESGQAESESREFAGLVRRQLPQIAQRLRLTLDKLSGQDDRAVTMVSSDEWWQSAQERYQGMQIGFARAASGPVPGIPAAVFDNVLDNLLANAVQKRAATSDLLVTVTLESAPEGCRLIVGDNGAPLDSALAESLFRGPVASRNGLGVGLYHAARMAEQQGYRLALASNQPGDVEFELAPDGQGTSGSPSG